MNKTKTKIAILGIAVLFAVLTVSIASADVTTLYLNPQHSNVLGYGETVEVEVRADAPHGINNGQIGISYDPSCAKVVDVVFNPAWWMTSWNVSTQSECWGPGCDWLKMWKSGDLGPDALLFTLTIKGNSTEYCKTDLIIGPGSSGVPPCHITCGNTSGGAFEDGFVTINGTFECGESLSETYEKELVDGWNLISLPLTPTSNDTSAVLSSMSGNYSAVYRYDAETNEFESVIDGTMDPGIGYFVNVTTAGTWSYEGQPYTSMSIDLKQGLNMVGWLNCTKQISGNLTSIASKYNYNARWNASYEVYEPQAPEVFNDFETMERGNGYWIAAKEDCILTESCSG